MKVTGTCANAMMMPAKEGGFQVKQNDRCVWQSVRNLERVANDSKRQTYVGMNELS